VTAELVLVERFDDPAAYRRVDVADKLVFGRGDLSEARRLAVERHGAIGLVTDNLWEFAPVRHRFDIPDALQYTSFWWTGAPGEKRCFGFVLSPKGGEDLRRLLNTKKAAGRPVRVHARVASSFVKGTIENVSAFIPGDGEADEEVLVVAHLCHPEASANDNASGAGAAMEAARALHSLIASGRLPRPRRGLRFLLVPEMTGTYAYLATLAPGPRSRIVAGINLDMVGENQDLCKSTLQVERPSLACPNYAGDLAAIILGELAQEGKNLSGTSRYALFRHAVTSFSGGSDHYILSDPSVGIPSPMIIQWPDRFYHTSQDTIDKVDPDMLRRVGVLTAAYAYFIAAARLPEATWLAGEMAAGFAADLHAAARSHQEALVTEAAKTKAETKAGSGVETAPGGEGIADGLAAVERWLAFRGERRRQDLLSLRRLVDPQDLPALDKVLDAMALEVAAAVETETRRLGTQSPQPRPGQGVPWTGGAPRAHRKTV